MGYLQQASSGIADSYQMTVSMWFKLLSTDDTGGGAGNFFKLISWGDNFVTMNPGYISDPEAEGYNPIGNPPYWDDSQNSFISVCTNPDFGLELNLMARPHSLGSNLGTEGADPVEFIGYDPGGFGVSHSGTYGDNTYGIGNIRADVQGLAFSIGTWYHLAVAIDISSGATLQTRDDGLNPIIHYHYNAAGMLNGSAIDLTGLLSPAFVYAGNDQTVPVFPMWVSGAPFTVPGINAVATVAGPWPVATMPANNQRLQMFDVQVWAGQYIDPVSNYESFVTLSGGHGTPTPTSVAASAFGLQTVLFKGNKSAFPLNLGSGGDFTKIGTINDARPGPSF